VEGRPCPTQKWARRLGGVDRRASGFEFYVEGRAERPVILDRATVHVKRAAAPLEGTGTACRLQARLTQRSLQVALRRSGSRVKYVTRDPRSGTTRTSSFRFLLREKDVEDFRVDAVAVGCHCEWTLRLSYLVGGKRRTYEVTDRGAPFVTSSGERAPAASYVSGRWQPIR
jgi:hypothetical protein